MAGQRTRGRGARARPGGIGYPRSAPNPFGPSRAPDFSRTYIRKGVTRWVTRARLQLIELSKRTALEQERGFRFHDGWSCEQCGGLDDGAARVIRNGLRRQVIRDLCAQCIRPGDEPGHVG